MPQRGIDRDKLGAAIRKLGDKYVCYMLDDAIDLLPQSKLVKLVGQYLDVANLRPDGKTKGTLLCLIAGQIPPCLKQFEGHPLVFEIP